jgi:hypothetical protein
MGINPHPARQSGEYLCRAASSSSDLRHKPIIHIPHRIMRKRVGIAEKHRRPVDQIAQAFSRDGYRLKTVQHRDFRPRSCNDPNRNPRARKPGFGRPQFELIVEFGGIPKCDAFVWRDLRRSQNQRGQRPPVLRWESAAPRMAATALYPKAFSAADC